MQPAIAGMRQPQHHADDEPADAAEEVVRGPIGDVGRYQLLGPEVYAFLPVDGVTQKHSLVDQVVVGVDSSDEVFPALFRACLNGCSFWPFVAVQDLGTALKECGALFFATKGLELCGTALGVWLELGSFKGARLDARLLLVQTRGLGATLTFEPRQVKPQTNMESSSGVLEYKLKQAKNVFTIVCDWTLSGSTNPLISLLEYMNVAKGASFSSRKMMGVSGRRGLFHQKRYMEKAQSLFRSSQCSILFEEHIYLYTKLTHVRPCSPPKA